MLLLGLSFEEATLINFLNGKDLPVAPEFMRAESMEDVIRACQTAEPEAWFYLPLSPAD